jgi:hypothetical protein
MDPGFRRESDPVAVFIKSLPLARTWGGSAVRPVANSYVNFKTYVF